jgi:hypothetical protein
VYRLNKGDKVLVWWEGREYVYEVQKVFESMQKPEIQDEELYLYTYLFWREDERIFVYSKEYDIIWPIIVYSNVRNSAKATIR